MINIHKAVIQVNGMDVSLQALLLAIFVCVLAVTIILGNIVIISTYINYKGPVEVVSYYFLSLSVVDLLIGILILPSIYVTLTGHWIFGDMVCRLEGYLMVTLFSISVYTFMWISVDRFLAVRKPLRYDTVQTKTRCQCWVAFTWISSFMITIPPLLGVTKPVFDKHAAICSLDWGDMKAYTTTLIILVLGPSLISIIYNYTYIFSIVRKIKSGETFHDKEFTTAITESFLNPNHIISFILLATFWIFWSPLICVRLYEVFTGKAFATPLMNFVLVWLGLSHSAIKFFVHATFSNKFKIMLKIFCLTICCRTRGRLHAELIGLDADD